MPLLDHFRPPVKARLPWRTLHAAWLSELTNLLNEILPPGYVALESRQAGGRLELDVGTYELEQGDAAGRNGTTAVKSPVWTLPAPTASFQATFTDVFEIRVYDSDTAGILVAAIELISPANKDRPAERRAFAAKCADYLGSGACVVILDAVTVRRANLHNEVLDLIEAPREWALPPDPPLYAATYRPVLRDDKPAIDLWTRAFKVGDPLPTMPLRLTGDEFVPVDFETTYTEACRRRRLI